MESFRIHKSEEGKCNICGKKSKMILESLDTKKNTFLCAKHYVEYEGENEIENDLKVLSKWEDYKRWHPDIAKEITQKFPKLADKYGKTLRKIIQTQEKRPKKKT